MSLWNIDVEGATFLAITALHLYRLTLPSSFSYSFNYSPFSTLSSFEAILTISGIYIEEGLVWSI